MNSPDYEQLRTLLQTRLDTIADTQLRDSDPAEQLRRLQEVSEAITQWQADTKGIPQQLNHYLKQSSLSKALEFVQGL